MKMYPEDMKKYPKCTALITTLEGTLKGKPKVLNAFLQACTADDQFQPSNVAERIARERALRWAAGPRIDVHDGLIRATAGGEVVEACGFQPPYGSGQLILITSIWFEAFEFGSGADRDNNANRLTRTLLHGPLGPARGPGLGRDTGRWSVLAMRSCRYGPSGEDQSRVARTREKAIANTTEQLPADAGRFVRTYIINQSMSLANPTIAREASFGHQYKA